MKKGFIKILTTGLVLSASMGLAACDSLFIDENEVQYSIYNYDNTYDLNEIFSLEGAKLKLTKPDGTVEEITISNDMIKNMPNMSTAGTKTIVVVYEGNEYELSIEVIAPPVVNPVVQDYSFTGYAASYNVGDVFDISNLKLSIDYDIIEDVEVPVTSQMITEMPNMSTAGTKTIVVAYNGEEFTFTFYVKDEKDDMIAKIQQFMQNYNSSSVKDTGIKINIEGTAKYLQNSKEFNTEIQNINISSLKSLEGYKIYKITYPNSDNLLAYMFHKEFASYEDYDANKNYIDFIGIYDYVVVETIPNEDFTNSYGKIELDYAMQFNPDINEISFEYFADSLKLQNTHDEWKDITIFNYDLANPIYKAIINSVVNATTSITRGDIVSAKNNLTAKLDTLKTLQKFGTEISTFDYYDYIINTLLLTDDTNLYVELARNSIASLLSITDQNTLDELDSALTNDINKIRNNQLTDVETTYDMIVELNNIIQESNGNAVLLEKLDIIVDSIDTLDKNMLSKFVYSLKDLATIYELTPGGETTDYQEAISGNRFYNGDYRYNNENEVVYIYYNKVTVSNSADLVEEYYAGLKSFISRFENASEYTDIRDFANDLIADLRTMDEVVKVMEENSYKSDFVNFSITYNIRMIIDAYLNMYDTDMISSVIAMLGNSLPEDAQIYTIVSDDMAPALVSGDEITIKSSETYNVGDIILFRYNESDYAHRIIGIINDGGNDYYICHGDNIQSANPSQESIANWQDDAQYIQSLMSEGKTKEEIETLVRNVQIIEKTDIVGTVIDVNGLYLNVPQNLLDALQDCTDIMYSELGSHNIDYVKLIEDICERLGLEKDYYLDKYNANELTIFADTFDKYIDTTEGTEAQLAFYATMRSACVYMDNLLVQGTDRITLINQINACAQACIDILNEAGQEGFEAMALDCIIKITNTEQDFNTNINQIINEYKTVIRQYLTMFITSSLNISDNEGAVDEIDHIVNYHLTAYLKDRFVVGDLIADMNDIIDTHAEEDVSIYAKSVAILSMILINQGQDVDYNELLGSIELPNEIKDVDFNKLINETLKDKETYDILNIEDVKVDYITDEHDNIVKEVLTITLNANYDILLSSLNSKFTITIEINF